MPQFLYRIQPSRKEMLIEGVTPEEEEVIAHHFSYLENLLSRGVLILAGRTLTTDEDSFGIVIFQAESESAARHIMENDPAVQQGVMKASLFPYRVALMSNNET